MGIVTIERVFPLTLGKLERFHPINKFLRIKNLN